MTDNRQSQFDRWMCTTYGFYPDGTPCNEAASADSPQQFLTKDGTFDMLGYERWVERMKKQYDAITLEKLPDGSYGLCSGGFSLESDSHPTKELAPAATAEPTESGGTNRPEPGERP